MKLKTILVVIVLISIFSCTNDKEDDLIEEINIEVVKYNNDVKTIIDNNCIICHHSGTNPLGPFPLETFEQVKDKAQNGALLERIELPNADPAGMPQTGRMPQATIDVITAWADNGFLE